MRYLMFILLFLSVEVVAEQPEARAIIKAPERTLISAQLVAKVSALPVREGDYFEPGDVLVELECDVFEAEKNKVIAERELAELRVMNARQLHELDAIGRIDLGVAEAELKRIEAELSIVNLNTQRCVIRSPYRGAVVQLNTNKHQLARQNEELMEIVSNEHLEAEIVVPASWLSWLTDGQQVSLHIEELGQQESAVIERISPVIDPVSRTLVIRARINNPPKNLRPGMSALAVFDSAS